MPSRAIDTTVHINAGPDAVWDVLTDFASYQERNPGTHIEGAPEVGTKLHAHLTGMSLNPKCSPPPPARNSDGSASSQPGPQTTRRAARQSSKTQLALKDKIAGTHPRADTTA